MCLMAFPAFAGSWTFETVDSAVFLGGPLSLAYDPIDRHPSIAYQDVTSKGTNLSNLKFAHWDGTRWVIEVIGPMNGELKLAYNPVTGQPPVAYRAQLAKTKYGLVLATRSPTGTWTKETVEPGLPSDLSLAYDQAGVPAIAYITAGRRDSTIYYTRKLGTSWPKQAVETGAFEQVSLAFGPANLPAIAYNPHDATQYCLGFALWNGSSWTKETVECGLREEGPYGYGTFPWLSYSPNGDPAIASVGGGSASWPRYSRRAGSWATEVIDQTPTLGSGPFRPSLGFTGDGVPYVGFVSDEGAVEELRVAHLEGTTWVVELVTVAPLKYRSQLALDPSGAPTVAFYDAAAGELKFARRTTP
jgi:hypothetical protein